MIKKMLFLAAVFAMSFNAQAQLEEQYTMFMLSKLNYNPAYAGADAPLSINALVRKQWMGFEGAPFTQKINTDFTLLNERVGVGVSLRHSTAGITEQVILKGSYAYRFQLGNGYLGTGINGSVKYLGTNYQDKRLFSSIDISLDGSVPMETVADFEPNFGVGLYFNNKKLYLGASIPNMLNIKTVDVAGETIFINPHHYYMMFGYNLKFQLLEFTPQFLVKYVEGAPFDADINVMATYNEKLKLGLGYRIGGDLDVSLGESVSIMAGLPVTKLLFFGMSYDMSLSELKKYSSGSLEGVLQYRINSASDDASVSPRFF